MKKCIRNPVLAGILISLFSPLSMANLIVNGDFEAGNTGFTSDYSFSTGGITSAATYAITTNPGLNHSLASDYGDNTSGFGNMMAVNGSTLAGQTVWQQTLAVAPNTSYDFAAYISSWFPDAPSLLNFSVNNQIIGSLQASSTTGTWDLFFANWSSGSSSSATIEIVNSNTASGGNDFALDDIYFGNDVFTSVPEPEPIMLLLPALLMLRLRKKR